MLISKLITVEFANPRIRAVDHIQDIRKAAEHAGLNLFSRHDIRLQYPMVTPDDKVVVEVKIPEDKLDSFNPGNRLRGISAYMLKKWPERYKDIRVGDRLLTYTDPDAHSTGKTAPPPEDTIPMADRLESIIRFTRLLERNDKESIEQINQILGILNKTPRTWEEV